MAETKKATHRKHYKVVNETTVFYLERSNLWMGIVCTLIAVVPGALAVFHVPPNQATWLVLAAVFLLFSLLGYIPSIIMRVYVNSEAIAYRKWGKKISIRWAHADHVFIFSDRQTATVYGDGKIITVGTIYDGFSHMAKLIEHYAHVSIGDEHALAEKEAADAEGKPIRQKKFLLVLGVICFVLGILIAPEALNP